MRLRLGFLGRGPTLHAGAGLCCARRTLPRALSGPWASRRSCGHRGAPAFLPGSGSTPGARVARGQVSSCSAPLLSMRLYAGSCLLRSADSPAWLPDASSVHPNAPRERHDVSERVSSPLSDQRAVRASSGSARPGPRGGTACLERHRLAKTGTTSARRRGASWKPAR